MKEKAQKPIKREEEGKQCKCNCGRLEIESTKTGKKERQSTKTD